MALIQAVGCFQQTNMLLKECIFEIESKRKGIPTSCLEEKEDMLIYAPTPTKGSIPIEYWKKHSVVKEDVSEER